MNTDPKEELSREQSFLKELTEYCEGTCCTYSITARRKDNSLMDLTLTEKGESNEITLTSPLIKLLAKYECFAGYRDYGKSINIHFI